MTQIETDNFNPLTDIPTNDEQAEIAIKFEKDPITGSCGCGLYKIYRERDNASIIQAYERALLAMLPEKRTPIL